MSQLDELLPALQVRVPGAPTAVLKLEVQRVARDFFRRTEVYEKEYVIASETDETEYDVQAEVLAGEHVDVVRVMSVWPEDWSAGLALSAYSVSEAGVVTLVTAIDTGVDIIFKAVLVPRKTWTALDQTLFTRHSDAIEAGALSELYSLPYGWKDPAEALRQQAEYERLCGKAKGDRLKGRQNRQLFAALKQWD